MTSPAIIIREIPHVSVKVQGKCAPVVATPPSTAVVIEMAATGRPGPPGADGTLTGDIDLGTFN